MSMIFSLCFLWKAKGFFCAFSGGNVRAATGGVSPVFLRRKEKQVRIEEKNILQ